MSLFCTRLCVLLTVVPLLLAACGDSSSTGATSETRPTTSTVPTRSTTTDRSTTTARTTTKPAVRLTTVQIRVVGGVPKGGIARPKVRKGDRVVLVVRSDVADEVHLHGYDLSRDVAAGGVARIAFRADTPGRFEVELEQRGVPLAEISVE